MEAQETELKRRVLAHARILQALIRHLAEDSPEVLSRLKKAFGLCHTLGEYEHNYSSTEQYGEMFVRAIEQDMRGRKHADWVIPVGMRKEPGHR